MKSFANTNAVVTGASSGIGQATAIALAKAGAQRVLIHFHRNEDGANETAERVREAGSQAVVHSGDLSDAAQRDALIEFAWKDLSLIHTWVNNAGLDVLTGEIADADFDTKLQRLMAVDVMGTIALSRKVAIRIGSQRLAKPPSMTFIGWDQAPEGMEGDAGQMFGPVKAAVMAFAKSLAQEVAPLIRINTVAPGWIQTKWGESTGEYWDARAKEQALMNRWGSVEDVARAILYLADPANTFATGQTLNVNGGWNRTYQ
ncbi:SDR family NAD(P)-dependent oxidoreductase [Planctomycetes bacterium K23_9]|uniref:3-oxoacyl-[acyl-carrier-protein] reductase FabG n=1 Tax=Stieleria marina TaxID=1930275 RepID=A0A517NR31_9BACT|nr:3-oxoacyl-[acyl-carrier-protein] reductase FabG [Planctomycetes bacterium K23_9]